jgi:hypothetical protein
MRDYQMISPSLEGVLNHDSLSYEGIERPLQILRILDGPVSKGRGGDIDTKRSELVKRKGTKLLSEKDQKVLQEYFYDLYGVFMKRLSHFLVEADTSNDDKVKLQAMLQEMIRVKKWVGNN